MLQTATDSTDSTDSILAQLSSGAQYKQQLIDAVNRLIIEKDPTDIAELKSSIETLFKQHHVRFLTPVGDTTVFQVLLDYYKKTAVFDSLSQLIDKFVRLNNLCIVFQHLCRQRWHTHIPIRFKHYLFEPKPAEVHLHDVGEFWITCTNIGEAALVANMLESVLHEIYGIPFRSELKFNTSVFRISPDSEQVNVVVIYRQEDCNNITAIPPLQTQDELLNQCFLNPLADYYDYCQQKYGVCNTRGLTFSPPPSDTTQAIEKAADATADEINRPGNILLVTRIGLGAGNLFNARLTISGLCRKMPNLKINWILITDAELIPDLENLPPQVTLYMSDAMWKLFPVIRALSLNADIVANLPNTCLIFGERHLLDTPLALSGHSQFIVVYEYDAPEQYITAPPFYLVLRTGLQPGKHSLGLLKPETIAVPPGLDEKRRSLCQDEKIAKLFVKAPTAPLYFAYVYQPKLHVHLSPIEGLKITDVLALFVQHAKRLGHKQIKIVIPITLQAIRDAMQAYPMIFKDCMIDYMGSTETSNVSVGASLSIEVFNIFPVLNSTFRRLMDYAAAHNTPVVMTGDQSFMELFFTITGGFVFLYQLLEHKRELFEQIKRFAIEHHMTSINYILTQTEQGISSEEHLILLTQYLVDHYYDLKLETVRLGWVIRAQPDVVDSLVPIIARGIAEARKRAAMTTDNVVADVMQKGSDEHPPLSLALSRQGRGDFRFDAKGF